MTTNAVVAELIDPTTAATYAIIHMSGGSWCGAIATGQRAENGHRLWKPITRPARSRFEASVDLSEYIVPESLENPVKVWVPK